MKPILTVSLIVQNCAMAIDAMDFYYDAELGQFKLLLVDENLEYARLTKALGDWVTLVRWTDPQAKRIMLSRDVKKFPREQRVVAIDTMVLTFNSRSFSIHSVTPYVP